MHWANTCGAIVLPDGMLYPLTETSPPDGYGTSGVSPGGVGYNVSLVMSPDGATCQVDTDIVPPCEIGWHCTKPGLVLVYGDMHNWTLPIPTRCTDGPWLVNMSASGKRKGTA